MSPDAYVWSELQVGLDLFVEAAITALTLYTVVVLLILVSGVLAGLVTKTAPRRMTHPDR